MVDFVMGPHNNYDCTVQKDKSSGSVFADTVFVVGNICRLSYIDDLFVEQIILCAPQKTHVFCGVFFVGESEFTVDNAVSV